MKNIESLTSLYKRDTKGKIRIWTVQYGFDSDDVAGTRTIAGLVDGQKVTSEWNMSVAKNVGKANGTTAKTQAISEAKSSWDQKADKEYFEDLDINFELGDEYYESNGLAALSFIDLSTYSDKHTYSSTYPNPFTDCINTNFYLFNTDFCFCCYVYCNSPS